MPEFASNETEPRRSLEHPLDGPTRKRICRAPLRVKRGHPGPHPRPCGKGREGLSSFKDRHLKDVVLGGAVRFRSVKVVSQDELGELRLGDGGGKILPKQSVRPATFSKALLVVFFAFYSRVATRLDLVADVVDQVAEVCDTCMLEALTRRVQKVAGDVGGRPFRVVGEAVPDVFFPSAFRVSHLPLYSSDIRAELRS